MASSFDAVNVLEVAETNNMIEHNNLDVRTITMGISLLDCAAGDVDTFCDNIYKKITRYARDLVKTGEEISREFLHNSTYNPQTPVIRRNSGS